MKPAGSLLLLPAGVAFLCTVCVGEETVRPKLSEHIRKEISAKLPVFAAPAANTATTDVVPLDPEADILLLPKIEVREKRLPGNDPDVWLAKSVVQQKAMIAYKYSMTDLEWALNSWFVPLFSAPASSRAAADYSSAKISAELERLSHVIKTIDKLDHEDAVRLKRELSRFDDTLPIPDK